MAEKQIYNQDRFFTGGVLVSFKESVSVAAQKKTLLELSENEINLFSAIRDADYQSQEYHMEDLGLAVLNGLKGYDLGSATDEEIFEITQRVGSRFENILALEPEKWYFPIGDAQKDDDELTLQNAFFPGDQPTHTWGLHVTGVMDKPQFTGEGISVAVLDTGLDLNHPDFAGRVINAADFVNNGSAQDGNGHGTHCIGTALGNGFDNRGTFVRYGIAHKANIWVGKVLPDLGPGATRGIIAGMRWAIDGGCEIISMSLGSRVWPGQGYSYQYEQVAKYGLEKGTLTIAAAGNESERSNGYISPTGSPANCPSIMAVAALDQRLRVADFSCGDVNQFPGSEINIAAPGVNVFSSWPMVQRYHRIDGTSMACPHVAGIAALYAQSDRKLRGALLRDRVQKSGIHIYQDMADVGTGIVSTRLL